MREQDIQSNQATIEKLTAKLTKLYAKRDSLVKKLHSTSSYDEERKALQEDLFSYRDEIRYLEYELQWFQEREGTTTQKEGNTMRHNSRHANRLVNRRMQLRQAAKNVGYDDQIAFQYVAEQLANTNGLLLTANANLTELNTPLEDEEGSVLAPNAGQVPYAAFLKAYIGQLKDCREFLLNSLQELWGIAEEEIVEEEEVEPLEEELEE